MKWPFALLCGRSPPRRAVRAAGGGWPPGWGGEETPGRVAAERCGSVSTVLVALRPGKLLRPACSFSDVQDLGCAPAES